MTTIRLTDLNEDLLDKIVDEGVPVRIRSRRGELVLVPAELFDADQGEEQGEPVILTEEQKACARKLIDERKADPHRARAVRRER